RRASGDCARVVQPPGGIDPLRGAQSILRRYAVGADRGDRHRGRCASRSIRGLAHVKAVILAAGYATRLRPVTNDLPKHLLPVGDRPMLDWVLDRIREVEDVDAIDLVTNSRFAPAFRRWADPNGVSVYDDGTSSNEDRLGAVGDLSLVIERAGLQDDELIVLAGDNLFEFSLPRFVAWWRAKPQPASAVPLHDVGDFELATQYGIAETDGEERIVRFVEKPSDPP